MRKNILFINLPSPWLINDKTYLSLGPLYIASFLEKHEFEVGYLDLAGKPEKEWVIPGGYSVYAVGATTPQIPIATKIVAKIKEANPDSLTVIGGIHATVMPGEILADSMFDVAVIGEGEYTMLEIMQGVPFEKIKGIAYSFGTGIEVNKERELIRDLDSLPYPAYHLVDVLSYAPAGYKHTGSVISARGCFGKCIFCAQNKITLGKVRYRSVQNVIGELKFLKETYGLESFCFEDETFVMGKRRLDEFCREIKKLGIKFKVQARVDTVNKEMLGMLKDAGCFEIGLGIESGCQRILDIIGKETTVEQNRKAILMAKDAGLRTFAFLIAGCPTEDDGSIDDTIRFVDETQPDACSVAMFCPYPGTKVFENPEKYRFEFVKPEDYNLYRVYDRSGHGVALHRNADEIYRLHGRLLEHVKEKSSFVRKDKEVA